MPKINTYANVGAPELTDKLIGTDVTAIPANQTKNFTVEQLGEVLGLANITTSISPAQMFNANLSPITLVPAPGEGKAIEPLDVVIFFEYNSVVYNAVADFNISMGGINYFSWDTTKVNDNANYLIKLEPLWDPANYINLATGAFNPYPGANELELITTIVPTLGDTTVYIKVTYKILNVGITI